ncbi:hypothetical protein [Halorubrum depositum]|uniref:hypothetical protein n=1 Tax=Halorubrum depositum TaxID=2583992 RepID=UPI0016435C2C|nr:hypothetical protein [Halorubrum depositum]
MSDDSYDPVAVLNIGSVVGIGVCAVLAAVGMFALPTLRRYGLGFTAAFWTVSAVELLAAIGIAYFVHNLHEERG